MKTNLLLMDSCYGTRYTPENEEEKRALALLDISKFDIFQKFIKIQDGDDVLIILKGEN